MTATRVDTPKLWSRARRSAPQQLTAAGATPVTVDLSDAAGIAAAVAGHDVVANLATHIPDIFKATRSPAWTENDRIRTEGARNLVDGALAGGAIRYVQESISFFDVDSGDAWVDEDTAMQAPEFAGAFRVAEREAQRFRDAGKEAVVLRFGMFYADTAHTQFQIKTARRGLAAPSGVYNVAESEPMRRGDLNATIAAALGKKRAISIPGLTKVGGANTEYFGRSVRIDSRRFRAATGWQPAYPSAREGWAQVAAEAG